MRTPSNEPRRRMDDEEANAQLPNRKWLSKPQTITVIGVCIVAMIAILLVSNMVFTSARKKEEVIKPKADLGGQPWHRPGSPPREDPKQSFPPLQPVANIAPAALGPATNAAKRSGGSLWAFTAGEDPRSGAKDTKMPLGENEDGSPQADDNDPLSNVLRPSNTGKTAKAHVLKHSRLVIPRGTPIPCILRTKIDTSRPGLVVCESREEVRGWGGGAVMLLPRWTRFTGQISHGLSVDQERVDVLWTSVLTPDNIEIAINSPGADLLGAPGIDGQVDNHIGEKIGAVLLYTVIEAGPALAVQAVQNQGRNQGNDNFNNYNLNGIYQPSERVAGRILQRKFDRPPILIKNQGEEITVMVAQNWDLSNVISLQAVR